LALAHASQISEIPEFLLDEDFAGERESVSGKGLVPIVADMAAEPRLPDEVAPQSLALENTNIFRPRL